MYGGLISQRDAAQQQQQYKGTTTVPTNTGTPSPDPTKTVNGPFSLLKSKLGNTHEQETREQKKRRASADLHVQQQCRMKRAV